MFPILWSLFVVAAFLLLQELLSPSSVSIISCQLSVLARILLWQWVRNTFRVNLTRLRLLCVEAALENGRESNLCAAFNTVTCCVFYLILFCVISLLKAVTKATF